VIVRKIPQERVGSFVGFPSRDTVAMNIEILKLNGIEPLSKTDLIAKSLLGERRADGRAERVHSGEQTIKDIRVHEVKRLT
jgi:hypothetical protein